jgi:citrate lyase beta subunit
MKPSFRPRRALLFCPGTERRKIEKASGLDVDSVIIDFEDGTAVSRKEEARAIAQDALKELDFGRSERLIRINAFDSGLYKEDLDEIGGYPQLPDGIVVPKVASASQLQVISEKLSAIEKKKGLSNGTVALLAIVETAMGVVRIAEITTASPRLSAIIFGAEDLCGDVGATRTPSGSELLYARSAVVMHSAAQRIQAIDTPFVDLIEETGLIRETGEALSLGFTGKLAIHPKQVPIITQVFTPSAEEIGAAKRVVEEHERHQEAGRGVFALDGRMVDMPMVRTAQRVLARARE